MQRTKREYSDGISWIDKMLGLHVSKNNNPDNRACPVKCSWSSYFTGVNPVKTTSRRPLIMCEGSFCSGSKEPAEQGECASTDVERNSAWDLRQRLSPKAQPWDSGNTEQEKRQAMSGIEGLVSFAGTCCHVDFKQRFSLRTLCL